MTIIKNNADRVHPGTVPLVPLGALLGVCLGLGGCATSDWQTLVTAETALMDTRAPKTARDDASRGGSAASTTADKDPAQEEERAEPPVPAQSAQELAQRQRDEGRARPVLYPGTDNQVRLPEPQKPVKFLGDDVSLNFEQAPLNEIVHAIMSDILQLDYVVDRPIEGKVTLRTRTPIPRDELLVVLESLLKAHSALMIRGEDGRYLVTGSQQSMTLNPRINSADDEAAGFSTIIVPLQYISATAMSRILEPLAEKSAFVRVDDTRNLLVLAGTRAQLSGWLNIVTTFDVDMLAGMSVGLFPLENMDVMEAAGALQALIQTADGGQGDISRIVRILPMQRLNSLLVVSPRAHYLDRVGKWVERLDVQPDERFEKRLHVYPVQNTNASRLAGLLNSIYSGGTGGAGARSGAVDGNARVQDRNATAPGLSPESIGGGGASAGLGAGGNVGGPGGGGLGGEGASGIGSSMDSSLGRGGRTAGGVTAVSMGAAGFQDLADVRVVADEENNALMIYANGRQYEIIEDALEQLDVVATQVIIEASIMEVQLTDELRYGLEWTFNNGLGSRYDGSGLLSNSAGGPAAVAPGFSYTVTNSIGDISAVLNALSQQSLINVISSPSVMVLDNHTATISVGDQVPVLEGQTITNGGNSVQNITYRDTGVQLSVMPSVNAGGLVTMDIEQSVIDVGSIDSATGQRSFLDRTINSRVAVRSSESVVLGGLIRENSSLGDSGVPILHKIPVVGSLFGNTTTDSRRTELLVIITPRALYNEDDLREVSEEMREQVRFMELLDTPPAT
ncbi:MAG: type II secretion system secretin GspD, partial [Halieaceae bacterium]|nr:type II secretion system secretin GspD [Halieaceae bacterium]